MSTNPFRYIGSCLAAQQSTLKPFGFTWVGQKTKPGLHGLSLTLWSSLDLPGWDPLGKVFACQKQLRMWSSNGARKTWAIITTLTRNCSFQWGVCKWTLAVVYGLWKLEIRVADISPFRTWHTKNSAWKNSALRYSLMSKCSDFVKNPQQARSIFLA